MTPDEARALIAEGRQHDEAMTPGEWAANTDEDYDGEIWQHDLRRLITSVRIVPVAANAQGIAWLRTNLARLLDGYTEALEEIERMRSELVSFRDDIDAACTDEGWWYKDRIDRILEAKP